MNSVNWADDIAAWGEEREFPDGAVYQSLSVVAAKLLADRHKVSCYDVELEALKQEILPERYARNRRILSLYEQIDLLSSSVAVVGAGGLGGSVAEILARLGVGRLVIIDGDTFEASNLNRQLFSSAGTLGQPKVEVAKARIAAVNETVTVTIHQQYLAKANATDLLGVPDVVIDCLDTIPIRFVLQDAANQIGVPMVSAAIAGLMGQITTIFPGDPGLSSVYGDSEQIPQRGIESSLGNLAPTVMCLAGLQCAEVIKILLRKPGLLRNRLLLADLEHYTLDTMFLSDHSS